MLELYGEEMNEITTNAGEIEKIYKEIDFLVQSLIPNENKANDLRKIFERVLKLLLGYDASDNQKNLYEMINLYVLDSKRKDLQYISHRLGEDLQDKSHKLRIDLNPWAHDNPAKLDNESLLEYSTELQNIIQEMTGISNVVSSNGTKSFSLDKLTLNTEQEQAILSQKKLILVNAGPGTGKTYLIIGRILNELNSDNSKKMFGLSFTNKASEGLQQKLDNEIFSTTLLEYKNNIYTGTLHSFALKLIQDYFEINKKTFDFIIIDDVELKDIAGEYNNDEIEINKYLKENKILTFDMIIDLFLNTIKNNERFQNFLSNKIDEIVIDEAQDLDEQQYEILYLLFKHIDNLKLFFVGDQRQNIYAFKGGSLSNIRKFFNDETNVAYVELKYSYRCPQTVLSFVNKFNFKDEENIELIDAYKKDGNSLKLLDFENKEEEANWIAKLIENKKTNNTKLNDIAIIYTTTFYFQEILEALNAFKIPFKVFGGQWVIDENIRLLRFILSYIYTSNNYALKNIQKFWINHELEGKNIDEVLISLSDMNISKKPNYKNLQTILMFIKKQQEKITDPLDILTKYLKEIEDNNLFTEKEIDILGNLKNIIENDLNLNDYDALKLSFSPMHPELNKFYLRSDEIVDSEWYNDDDIFVNVNTVHSAKGLEWNNVIIPGMAQDSFPRWYPDDETKDKEIPNELKKFYVACTRSKENLYLTRPKNVKIKSKKNGKYYTFERDVSMFVSNL